MIIVFTSTILMWRHSIEKYDVLPVTNDCLSAIFTLWVVLWVTGSDELTWSLRCFRNVDVLF
jgi:hypothetical protein